MDEIEDVWQQIDHQLVTLKLKVAFPAFVKEIEDRYYNEMLVSKRPRTRILIGHWIDGIDRWAAEVCRIYEEVWKIQGREKTPQYVAVTFKKGIIPGIKRYLGKMRHRLTITWIEPKDAAASFVRDGLAQARAAADLCRRRWSVKCEIEARELTYRPKQLPNGQSRGSAAAIADEAHDSTGIGSKPSPDEEKEPSPFDPKRYGGREVCIVVSYGKARERNMRTLSRMLADKAHIKYERTRHRDAKSWFRENPAGFRDHVHQLRKRAKKKKWFGAIPTKYWESYKP